VLRLRLKQLDAVLFTHEHKDHTAGLDEIRATTFGRAGYTALRPCDRPGPVETGVRLHLADHKYPGIPHVRTAEIRNEPFEVLGVHFIPIEVMHHKLPVFGFRIGDFTT
jgi:phosphoribosyl 1,2-cyclic phosphate phosphodiesterase